jgi:hypothetical protein
MSMQPHAGWSRISATLAFSLLYGAAQASDRQEAPASGTPTTPAVTAVASECPGLMAEARRYMEDALARQDKADWEAALNSMKAAQAQLVAMRGKCATATRPASEAIQVQGLQAQVDAALPALNSQVKHIQACLPSTEQAVAADVKAFAAEPQKVEGREVASLYQEAIMQWEKAKEDCEGKHRDKAEANLQDTTKAFARFTQSWNATSGCEAALNDARLLKELGEKAGTAQQWEQAAVFFRKSEPQWERADERCIGSRQDEAQTQLDAVRALAEKAQALAADAAKAAQPGSAVGANPAPAAPTGPTAPAAPNGAAASVAASAPNTTGALAAQAASPAAPALAATGATVAGATGSLAASAGAAAVGAAAATEAASVAGAASTNAPASGVAASTPTASGKQDIPGRDFAVGNSRYVGKFVWDVDAKAWSGSGTIRWENGEVFEGNLVRGVRQGNGKYTWPSGQWYSGDWIDDEAAGVGVIQFANKNFYKGGVKSGKPHGKGRMSYSTGEDYVGDFADGEPHGEGVYTWVNGDRYEGGWQAGLKHGQGSYLFASGERWVGRYENDQQTAQGKLIKKSLR